VNVPAVREPVAVNLGRPITDLDQAMRAADMLSRSDLLPRALRGNAPNTLLVMLTGQELELSLTQAFRTIYVPSGGQPQLRGVLVLALLRRKNHTYRFEETDDSCTFTVVRGDTGEEYSASFTIEDAITAKLAKRNANGDVVALSDNGKELPWMLYRRDLLMWRAVARGALRGAPEVMLGFEIQGGSPPEPQEPVELRPENPAPPEPAAGQAAPSGGQAAQAEQLRQLDEQIAQGRGTHPSDVITEEERLAVLGGETGRPEGDPYVGGIPESGGESAPSAIDPDMADDLAAETAPPVDEPGDSPVDAAGKAKTKVLAEWFTKFGYDPKLYRANVLRACSVYTRRNIAGVRDLKASEVMELCNELAALWRVSKTSELAPVSMLADQVNEWAQAWESEDPTGYTLYTGPQ
jgi:hypothetical protein